jgi:hypothetical protein
MIIMYSSGLDSIQANTGQFVGSTEDYGPVHEILKMPVGNRKTRIKVYVVAGSEFQ